MMMINSMDDDDQQKMLLQQSLWWPEESVGHPHFAPLSHCEVPDVSILYPRYFFWDTILRYLLYLWMRAYLIFPPMLLNWSLKQIDNSQLTLRGASVTWYHYVAPGQNDEMSRNLCHKMWHHLMMMIFVFMMMVVITLIFNTRRGVHRLTRRSLSHHTQQCCQILIEG